MQLNILLNLAVAGVVALVTHEGGHFLAALVFGQRLRFRFAWGRLFGVVPVPRGTWYMPDMARWKHTVVAMAGFLTEFAVAGAAVALGWPWLLFVSSVHLLAYPAYAGDANDFKWL